MSAIDISTLAPAKSSSRLYLARPQASFERVPSLDGLRAVSIMIVMLSHFVDSRLFPGGFGVLIFFVVSGFLITRLLLAEQRSAGRISLPNFYLRRFFRLYPVVTIYTVVVALYVIVMGLPFNFYEPASALFYFANYLYAWNSMVPHVGMAKMPFGIFWSLSVEEHFYLFFPALFVFVRGRSLIVWMLAVCALCLALRLFFAQLHPEWLSSHFFYYTDIRLDSIAFGVLVAAICETPYAGRMIGVAEHPCSVLVALAVILLCMLVRNDWFRETIRYSLLGLAVAAILAAIVFSPRYAPIQTVLNWSFLRWIGVLSYSLYVWHTFLPLLLHRLAPNLPPSAIMPANFVLALSIATLSYYAIEKPAAKLRHRFGSRTAA